MNERVTIKVLPGPDCNPDFAPDGKLQEGISCYGYLMIGFNADGDVEFSMLDGVSIKMISDALAGLGRTGIFSQIRQACAIAEGEIRAMQIESETRMDAIRQMFDTQEEEDDGNMANIRILKIKKEDETE